MINGKSILGIIPARGGSKGIPFKNIVDLNGKPLIRWAIEASISCRFIDKTIVSTNDSKIKKISLESGAEVPFKRPEIYSRDDSTSFSVIEHALNWLKKHGQNFDVVVLLQPTSPLRTSVDIDEALKYYSKINANAVISVCKSEHNPLWANTLPSDFNMTDFLGKEISNKNRQQLPQFYRLNGAIYISDVNYFFENKGFLGKKTYAYIMPEERSIDIDTEIDLALSKILLAKNPQN